MTWSVDEVIPFVDPKISRYNELMANHNKLIFNYNMSPNIRTMKRHGMPQD